MRKLNQKKEKRKRKEGWVNIDAEMTDGWEIYCHHSPRLISRRKCFACHGRSSSNFVSSEDPLSPNDASSPNYKFSKLQSIGPKGFSRWLLIW